MSLATVHYLSMNVRSGYNVAPAGVFGDPTSFSFTSLQPNTAYLVDFGLGTMTVTNKALTSNVATLTIGAHAIEVDDSVTVTGVDATFNGTYIVTAIAATTISYAKTHADVGSAAATGSVTTRRPATSNGSGAFTEEVTYLANGTYTVTVYEVSSGGAVVHTSTTVAFDGTITVTAPVNAGVDETVAFSAFAAAADYSIDWGQAAYVPTLREIATNVATLTIGTHGIKVDDVVTVAGNGAPWNGTFTVTAVAATTISFALVNADVPSEAATGTVNYRTLMTTVAGAGSKVVNYPTVGAKTITVYEVVGGAIAAQTAITVAA